MKSLFQLLGIFVNDLLVDSLIRPKLLVGRLTWLELCTVLKKKSLVLAFIALEYLEQF